MAFDPFNLSSGLPEGDMKITDAIFAFDPEYQNGQALRGEFTVMTEDGEATVKLGCGNNWTTRDKGVTCEHESKPDANFNKNSGMGMFFGGAKDTNGVQHGGLVGLMSSDPAVEKALLAKVKEVPLGPRDRNFWIGMQIHVSRIDVDFRGEIGVLERTIIDGFNGFEGATTPAKAKAAAKKAPAKAAAKAEASGGLTVELKAKLDALADECENSDEFAERAFAEIPEASGDDAVKAAVLDLSPEGIWEQAVERYNAENPS